jgi:hypothetical protein
VSLVEDQVVQRAKWLHATLTGGGLSDVGGDEEAISWTSPTVAPLRSRHVASVAVDTICVHSLADL